MTDPVVRKPTKPITFPGLQTPPPLTVTSANGPVAIINEDQEPNGYSTKRRRISPDTNSKLTSAPMYQQPPPPGPSDVEVVFGREEFLAFLQRGLEKGQLAKSNTDVDLGTQRKMFDAAIARANKRANDAHDSLRFAHHDSGEKLKERERYWSETLKAKMREHTEEKQLMRREFDREQKHREDIQTKNIDALARQNDKLEREIDTLRRERPDERERQLEHEIMTLRQELESARRGSREAPAQPPQPSPVSILGHQDLSTDQSPSDMLDKIKSLQAAQEASDKAFQASTVEFSGLSSDIAKLTNEFDDMPNKLVIRSMSSIQDRNQAFEANMALMAKAFASLRGEIEALVQHTNARNLPGANGMTASDHISEDIS